MSSAAVRAPFPAPVTPFPLEKPLPEPGHSRLLELPRGVVPGSQLEVRPAPAVVSSGIPQIDALTGGLPRGALTEIYGQASSGRTSLVLAALAEASRRQEACALVDASDSLHPESAAAGGMDLQRLLWIRCGQSTSSPRMNAEERGSESIHKSSIFNHQSSVSLCLCGESSQPLTSSPRMNAEERRPIHHSSFVNRHSSSNRQSSGWEHRLEQVLKATDLLLQSGGFGLVVVDLADVPPRFARRIPLASWFRFRRAVENTPTVLVVVEQEPYAKICASLVLKMQRNQHSAVSAQHSAREAPNFHLEYPKIEPVPIRDGRNYLPAHAQILHGLPVEAEVVHARWQRKPARSATQFSTRAAWANSFAG